MVAFRSGCHRGRRCQTRTRQPCAASSSGTVVPAQTPSIPDVPIHHWHLDLELEHRCLRLQALAPAAVVRQGAADRMRAGMRQRLANRAQAAAAGAGAAQAEGSDSGSSSGDDAEHGQVRATMASNDRLSLR